jgi:hypothetical protein
MIVNVAPEANAYYLNGIVTLAGTGALLKFYTTPMPSTGGDPVGDAVQLGVVTCGDPLGTVAGVSPSVLTLSSISPDLVTDADGVAAWARLTTSGGDFIADFDVTLDSVSPPDTGAITLPDTQCYAGGVLSISPGATISL